MKQYTLCLALKKKPKIWEDIHAGVTFAYIGKKWIPLRESEKDEKISNYKYRTYFE